MNKGKKCKFKLVSSMMILLVWSPFILAKEPVYLFENPKQQAAFDDFLKEIRCVTCPNQSIAESGAPVAKAMQAEIYHRLKKGESLVAIRQYLLSHYGDYVVYRPLIKKQTWLLWFGPLILFLFGIGIWAMNAEKAK